jgi:ferredoxin
MVLGMYAITRGNLFGLLDALRKDYEIFVPVRRGQFLFFKHYNGAREDIVIGEVRTADPLKTFFFPARDRVADGFDDRVPQSRTKPLCIVGAKACDLRGFLILDPVFKDEPVQDPAYVRQRDEALILSADCTCAIDTCFCLTYDDGPYPRAHFDLNLAEVSGSFVVEVGSPRGEALMSKHAALFVEAKPEVTAQRDRQRASVAEQVQRNISQHNIPHQQQFSGMVQRNYSSPLWSEEAQTCVECGACNTICPTCHCFLLCDQGHSERMARFRLWDSCMLKDFAKVAGGANPRPHLWMRLRNRYEKKFDFFPQVAGEYACTGCGRCITACPAKIDIRRILGNLAQNGRRTKS